MRFGRLVIVGGAVIALLAGAVGAAAAHPNKLDDGNAFVAKLSGAAEVPPGDPNGSGMAHLVISPTLGQVCFKLEVEDVALPATAAHIHSGAAGVNGPVVIGLDAPGASGEVKGCKTGLDATLLNAIIASPAQYYVNVHTTDFPGGAVRGQLAAKPGKAAAPRIPVHAGRPLRAALTGAAEVPGPGDADGSGKAIVWVNAGQSRVCAWIKVKDIDAATAAHIHAGKKGVAGDVVVTLPTPDASGVSKGCVKVERALAKQILKNPAAYYVNVHNAAFPGGALRGQLGKR